MSFVAGPLTPGVAHHGSAGVTTTLQLHHPKGIGGRGLRVFAGRPFLSLNQWFLILGGSAGWNLLGPGDMLTDQLTTAAPGTIAGLTLIHQSLDHNHPNETRLSPALPVWFFGVGNYKYTFTLLKVFLNPSFVCLQLEIKSFTIQMA